MAETAYGLHRGHAGTSLFAMIGGGLLFLLIGLNFSGWERIVCLAPVAICVAAAAITVSMLIDKRPLLRISAEGLYYRPFADRAVPWAEITKMTHVMAYSNAVILGRVNWTRAPNGDQLNFAVTDLRAYPGGVGRALARGVQMISGLPPIAIQLWFVDAPPDAIFAEIGRYWSGAITPFHNKLAGPTRS